MIPFQLLYRDVDSLEVSNLDKEFVKSMLRDSAFSSYKDTSKIFEKNLPKAEFDALKILLNPTRRGRFLPSVAWGGGGGLVGPPPIKSKLQMIN